MRILLVGGTGLVGSAIHARLSAEGHECVLVSRHPDAAPDRQHVTLDVARTTDASKWKGILAGVDAVINAAGALQGQDMQGVHVAGSAALYTACESAGVRRVILFSAIGIDRDAPTDFSRTKREGEAALMACGLDGVVLRPSVVVGRPAYGGSFGRLPGRGPGPDAGLGNAHQFDGKGGNAARRDRRSRALASAYRPEAARSPPPEATLACPGGLMP
jgi:uncharacterized protein YbjT (DUF2867 family)